MCFKMGLSAHLDLDLERGGDDTCNREMSGKLTADLKACPGETTSTGKEPKRLPGETCSSYPENRREGTSNDSCLPSQHSMMNSSLQSPGSPEESAIHRELRRSRHHPQGEPDAQPRNLRMSVSSLDAPGNADQCPTPRDDLDTRPCLPQASSDKSDEYRRYLSSTYRRETRTDANVHEENSGRSCVPKVAADCTSESRLSGVCVHYEQNTTESVLHDYSSKQTCVPGTEMDNTLNSRLSLGSELSRHYPADCLLQESDSRRIDNTLNSRLSLGSELSMHSPADCLLHESYSGRTSSSEVNSERWTDWEHSQEGPLKIPTPTSQEPLRCPTEEADSTMNGRLPSYSAGIPGQSERQGSDLSRSCFRDVANTVIGSQLPSGRSGENFGSPMLSDTCLGYSGRSSLTGATDNVTLSQQSTNSMYVVPGPQSSRPEGICEEDQRRSCLTGTREGEIKTRLSVRSEVPAGSTRETPKSSEDSGRSYLPGDTADTDSSSRLSVNSACALGISGEGPLHEALQQSCLPGETCNTLYYEERGNSSHRKPPSVDPANATANSLNPSVPGRESRRSSFGGSIKSVIKSKLFINSICPMEDTPAGKTSRRSSLGSESLAGAESDRDALRGEFPTERAPRSVVDMLFTQEAEQCGVGPARGEETPVRGFFDGSNSSGSSTNTSVNSRIDQADNDLQVQNCAPSDLQSVQHSESRAALSVHVQHSLLATDAATEHREGLGATRRVSVTSQLSVFSTSAHHRMLQSENQRSEYCSSPRRPSSGSSCRSRTYAGDVVLGETADPDDPTSHGLGGYPPRKFRRSEDLTASSMKSVVESLASLMKLKLTPASWVRQSPTKSPASAEPPNPVRITVSPVDDEPIGRDSSDEEARSVIPRRPTNDRAPGGTRTLTDYAIEIPPETSAVDALSKELSRFNLRDEDRDTILVQDDVDRPSTHKASEGTTGEQSLASNFPGETEQFNFGATQNTDVNTKSIERTCTSKTSGRQSPEYTLPSSSVHASSNRTIKQDCSNRKGAMNISDRTCPNVPVERSVDNTPYTNCPADIHASLNDIQSVDNTPNTNYPADIHARPADTVTESSRHSRSSDPRAFQTETQTKDAITHRDHQHSDQSWERDGAVSRVGNRHPSVTPSTSSSAGTIVESITLPSDTDPPRPHCEPTEGTGTRRSSTLTSGSGEIQRECLLPGAMPPESDDSAKCHRVAGLIVFSQLEEWERKSENLRRKALENSMKNGGARSNKSDIEIEPETNHKKDRHSGSTGKDSERLSEVKLESGQNPRQETLSSTQGRLVSREPEVVSWEREGAVNRSMIGRQDTCSGMYTGYGLPGELIGWDVEWARDGAMNHAMTGRLTLDGDNFSPDHKKAWPRLTTMYDNHSFERDDDKSDVIMMYDTARDNNPDPYGAYKFYRQPGDRRARRHDGEPRTKEDGTTSGSDSESTDSLKRRQSCRVITGVFLVMILLCVIVAAVTLAILLTKTPSSGPIIEDGVFRSLMRLDNTTFTSDLTDPNSKRYKEIEEQFCDALLAIMNQTDSPTEGEKLVCTVTEFRNGSLIILFYLERASGVKFIKTLVPIGEHIKDKVIAIGRLGRFSVDKKIACGHLARSAPMTVANCRTVPPPPASTTTPKTTTTTPTTTSTSTTTTTTTTTPTTAPTTTTTTTPTTPTSTTTSTTSTTTPTTTTTSTTPTTPTSTTTTTTSTSTTTPTTTATTTTPTTPTSTTTTTTTPATPTTASTSASTTDVASPSTATVAPSTPLASRAMPSTSQDSTASASTASSTASTPPLTTSAVLTPTASSPGSSTVGTATAALSTDGGITPTSATGFAATPSTSVASASTDGSTASVAPTGTAAAASTDTETPSTAVATSTDTLEPSSATAAVSSGAADTSSSTAASTLPSTAAASTVATDSIAPTSTVEESDSSSAFTSTTASADVATTAAAATTTETAAETSVAATATSVATTAGLTTEVPTSVITGDASAPTTTPTATAEASSSSIDMTVSPTTAITTDSSTLTSSMPSTTVEPSTQTITDSGVTMSSTPSMDSSSTSALTSLPPVVSTASAMTPSSDSSETSGMPVALSSAGDTASHTAETTQPGSSSSDAMSTSAGFATTSTPMSAATDDTSSTSDTATNAMSTPDSTMTTEATSSAFSTPASDAMTTDASTTSDVMSTAVSTASDDMSTTAAMSTDAVLLTASMSDEMTSSAAFTSTDATSSFGSTATNAMSTPDSTMATEATSSAFSTPASDAMTTDASTTSDVMSTAVSTASDAMSTTVAVTTDAVSTTASMSDEMTSSAAFTSTFPFGSTASDVTSTDTVTATDGTSTVESTSTDSSSSVPSTASDDISTAAPTSAYVTSTATGIMSTAATMSTDAMTSAITTASDVVSTAAFTSTDVVSTLSSAATDDGSATATVTTAAMPESTAPAGTSTDVISPAASTSADATSTAASTTTDSMTTPASDGVEATSSTSSDSTQTGAPTTALVSPSTTVDSGVISTSAVSDGGVTPLTTMATSIAPTSTAEASAFVSTATTVDSSALTTAQSDLTSTTVASGADSASTASAADSSATTATASSAADTVSTASAADSSATTAMASSADDTVSTASAVDTSATTATASSADDTVSTASAADTSATTAMASSADDTVSTASATTIDPTPTSVLPGGDTGSTVSDTASDIMPTSVLSTADTMSTSASSAADTTSAAASAAAAATSTSASSEVASSSTSAGGDALSSSSTTDATVSPSSTTTDSASSAASP